MNRAQFAAPNTTPSAAAFGQVATSNSANYARRVQLQARFVF